ncbi:flagellar hook-basal body complex protein FliE [Stenotrophomonas sp. SAU14A_NAIMI4_5]|uniref:flagellar hook-basal body complex protein FliE n=1 Tax=Stenotrophomonas sp. SAU14A_NAIMI4_5 TaxID=2072413 RepID=UPI000D53F522|nr:flagellar hook-basal body complex protein FliE [Stenotrophomonas sp. SAU14A_NAIMI4_5]AWH49528.1 flagellar hook-basal body complex protein FliE [Stenotrophomonas sp. SAU14A_NAIMI4_5]
MSHSVTSILSQIRSYQTQMGQPATLNPLAEAPRSNALPGAVLDASQVQPASFTDTLRGAIAGVNDAQQKSGALAKAFELGEPGADLAKVMVASQQSQIAFRATVEVRNRLVQAYQDVMNMPL